MLPKTNNPMQMISIKIGNLRSKSLVLVLASFCSFGPKSSIINPIGQTKPQKALPRKNGRRKKSSAKSISVFHTPLIRELMVIKGLAKRKAPRNTFPRGQTVMVRRTRNRTRKNV